MTSLTGILLQILGTVAAVFIVVYQLGRQHRNSLLLQRENLRTEQQLRLFELVSKRIQEAEEAVATASALASTLPAMLRLRHKQKHELGRPLIPIRETPQDVLERIDKASKATTAIISAIEQNEIVDLALPIFRYAISHQLDEAQQSFSAFFYNIARFLPIERPPDLNPELPEKLPGLDVGESDLDEIEALGKKAQCDLLELSNYISDFSRAIQNRLLGEVFENQVPPRRPLEDGWLVITTDLEDIKKIESKLNLAEKIHPDVLPSAIITRQVTEQ